MDVIILDHHTVPKHLPLECLIVNPKRDPGTIDEPAACGIAYHVMCALYDALNREPNDARMIELAALGTVCDLAPLISENRRVVRDGLIALCKTERPGLRALIAAAGANPERIDTETIGFTIGPRLNAAGRLAHARLAFDLLRADGEQAIDLAHELDTLNRRRQEETERAFALAEELVADEVGSPLIMVGHEDFPLGIVGLVASRLADAHHRPAVVYRRDAADSRASCRSIPEFDITAALRACPDGTFVRFGGHRAAAGFTALNDRLPAIKEQLIASAETGLAGKDLTPAVRIDVEQPLAALRGDEIRWLAKLAPHGIKNPEPVFLSRGVSVVERMSMGQDGRHLRLKLRDGNVTWPAVAFRQPGDGIEAGLCADIVYCLSQERRTTDGLELRILDLQPSAPQ
jgi:single-stranded-DNA-specific exonuclease